MPKLTTGAQAFLTHTIVTLKPWPSVNLPPHVEKMDGPAVTTPSVSNGIAARTVERERSPHELSQVLEALGVIHDPRSSNTVRQQASVYLEHAKRHPQAPSHGYTLAFNKSNPPELRHYGLSLLEYSIKYGWDDYTSQQALAIRDYVVRLAQGVTESDPTYLRNKVAQLWAEISKREWGAEWPDMDEYLVHLWEQPSFEHKGVVLYILETLSEEVFNRDDPIAGLRGGDLGRACVEIFTPAAVLAEYLPARDASPAVRYGEQGWIQRLCLFLDTCLSAEMKESDASCRCAILALHALRASMSWLIPKAIAATQCLKYICKALPKPIPPLQVAAVEALRAICNRPHLAAEEFAEVVCQLYLPAHVKMLGELYAWSIYEMDINNLDEQKYTLCTKLSELLASLGSLIEQKPMAIPEGCDLNGLFGLLFEVLRNPSLVVSISALHCWTRLLRCRAVRDSDSIMQLIPALLEIASQRLVRYEALPDDSDDTTFLFLNEDIDTVPERHAFLGNYRRYCVDIVEVIVRKMPLDAMRHILGQADSLFKQLCNEQSGFDAAKYTKHSIPALRIDAQITVIDGALKGYQKWLAGRGNDPQRDEEERNLMQDTYTEWCASVLGLKFQDPDIRRKILRLLVNVATTALDTRPSFAVMLLDHMLDIDYQENPSFFQYNEAVKELKHVCAVELQRLAISFPNHFLTMFEDLKQKIDHIIATRATDDRQRLGFMAFLFIIIHRSSSLGHGVQQTQLWDILKPITDAWQKPEFTQSLSSFESFCKMIGMGRLSEFFVTHQFSKIGDWSTQPLDPEGQAMQENITKTFEQLPLRSTKALLAASTEKLREGTQAFEVASSLWASTLPFILPNLLQLISHAQAFNNLENWSSLPEELQNVFKRVLTDRFWQAGISTESRDDFFARVSGSKLTFEGFASTVRGTVRQIREIGYYILYGFARFGDLFYGITDLPEPLSQALYANAHALSAHHLSVLLSMSTQLIDGCPAHLRAHFLPPVVSGLFAGLDTKILSEWESLNRAVADPGQKDSLSDEMKTESILRQLSYSAISLVSSLLDYHANPTEPQGTPISPKSNPPEPMWKFVLRTRSILEPLLMFCKNTIRIRDTRCCSLAVKIIRATAQYFKDVSPVRSFLCCDVLQAAITSLHESYFVDVHKDLASLIALLLCLDAAPDGMPRQIILSLPGLGPEKAEKVDRVLAQIRTSRQEKQQRALVLDLLAGVRGVGIHELGKLEKATGAKRKAQGVAMYMNVEQQPRVVRGGSAELEGVAAMFGS